MTTTQTAGQTAQQGKQVLMHLENATLKGTVKDEQGKNTTRYNHPVVTEPGEGMVKIMDITRRYGFSDTRHSAWFQKKSVMKLVDYLVESGIPKVRVTCIKETMDCQPRGRMGLNGGLFVHPFLAHRYDEYLKNSKDWYKIPSVPYTNGLTKESLSSITLSKADNSPAAALSTPKQGNVPLNQFEVRIREINHQNEYWTVFCDTIEQFGRKWMFDTLDDIIFDYIRNNSANGLDDYQSDAIEALRRIRDVFRIEDMKSLFVA